MTQNDENIDLISKNNFDFSSKNCNLSKVENQNKSYYKWWKWVW